MKRTTRSVIAKLRLQNSAAILVLFAGLATSQNPNLPSALLKAIHDQAAELSPSDRVALLYQLSIEATAVSPKTSTAWSIEMYDCATNKMPTREKWEQTNRAAQRKNALTVLSLSDPDAAAERFIHLEPSPGHSPSEDPRVDLSRHLFPHLWAKHGLRSLPTIRRLALFTASSGEYPYAAVALLLPKLAQVDRRKARALFVEAVHQMPRKNRLHRTQDMYIRFLRAGWPIASHKERRQAVHAGILGAQNSVHDFEIMPGAHSYFEYYLPEGTVHLDSEADARIYDLLPFVDEVDRHLGQSLRQRYPHLQGLPIPRPDAAPWRSGVFAVPGRDTPDLLQRAFERHHLLFLETWAQQDARRAANLALSTKDLDRQRTALALVLPWLTKVDAAQAETWWLELERSAQLESKTNLDFLVALAKADFRLGHSDEARQLAWLAWKHASPSLTRNTGDTDIEAVLNLEDVCGQFWFGDPAWYAATNAIGDRANRLILLASYARGALRDSAGYEEAN